MKAAPTLHPVQTLPGFLAAVVGRAEQASLPVETDEETRRASERSVLAQCFDVAPERVVFLKQEHGVQTLKIDGDMLEADATYQGVGDALFTEEPGIVIAVRTADCLPVFVWMESPNKRLAGLIHAGWRGMADGIISSAIVRMLGRFAEETPRVTWATGPAAGGQRYEVGPEVARRFELPGRKQGDRYLLDLTANAALQIDRLARNHGGSAWKRLRDFEACTIEENRRFFSHRCGDTGRNLNATQLQD
ncbi:MAG: polyphenol oxidase family protein [Leptospiraceae bacterium]|nr:polyphenol oxidase family protein [Leptospiraceae bacterium]MCP5485915.1 polyphenol oxidase family protein [Spirochaetales bacterium]